MKKLIIVTQCYYKLSDNLVDEMAAFYSAHHNCVGRRALPFALIFTIFFKFVKYDHKPKLVFAFKETPN